MCVHISSPPPASHLHLEKTCTHKQAHISIHGSVTGSSRRPRNCSIRPLCRHTPLTGAELLGGSRMRGGTRCRNEAFVPSRVGGQALQFRVQCTRRGDIRIGMHPFWIQTAALSSMPNLKFSHPGACIAFFCKAPAVLDSPPIFSVRLLLSRCARSASAKTAHGALHPCACHAEGNLQGRPHFKAGAPMAG